MIIQESHSISESMPSSQPVKPLDYISFEEMLKQRFDAEETKDIPIALLFIEFHDLSRFNDAFGFNIDEQLILKISDDIGFMLESEDILTRPGNHQLVMMKDISSGQSAEVLAKRIMHMLSEPCVIDEHMFYIQASIGISLYPLDERDVLKLIESAKNTMLHVQEDSKKNIGFSKDRVVTVPCEKTIHLMSELPAAIENGEIYFRYQAQYSHARECFVGAELLARWNHPEYGEISPDIFISMAEQIGMIGPLTIKAFDAASKAFTVLRMNGNHNFSLSINISPTFLMASNFDETIDFLMEQYDLSGEQMNFEITEEILLKHTDALLNTLEKIKSHNIGIELDDFGTGYTSLQHLAYLPIDTLKVDRSFVSDIAKDIKKKALFKAIVDMAKALDLQVIAEGVEGSAEDDIIKSYDSIITQGYFYSRPIGLDQLIEKLKV